MPPLPRDATGQPLENLTVFVVPHSHDDLGWQRTVDEYYEEEVRYIYDSVIDELQKDASRKFLFVETGFFMRWWLEQSDGTKETTRSLVKAGQIDFVNGAWCMADDASPAFDDQIDQITLGHRFVKDTLGVDVKIAWHIDPFGLSSSYAALWGAMNFTAWVFNRVDTRLKDLWHNETRLQFDWIPNGTGTNPGVFSHVLDTHYGAPSIHYKGQRYHFDYEVFSGLGGGEDPGSDLPVSETNPSPFYNSTVEAIAEAFVAIARLRAGWYHLGAPYQKTADGTGVVLIPFGDDMKFQNAMKQYSNMDRIIAAVNSRFDKWGVHLRYGTLTEYFDLINTDASQAGGKVASGAPASQSAGSPLWPTYDSDFMPLGTNENVYTSQVDWNASKANTETEYWTGHYTTRPLMKQLTAEAGRLKHTSEIALSLFCARNSSDSTCDPADAVSDLMLTRKITGALQHHDSITGTSRPEVTADLDVRLRASIASSLRTMSHATAGPSTGSDGILAVVSVGDGVSLFNGMLQRRVTAVTVVLEHHEAGTALRVVTSAGAEVDAAVLPPVPGPFTFPSTKGHQLVFLASLGPLETAVYTVERKSSSDAAAANYTWTCHNVGSAGAGAGAGGDVMLAGNRVQVTFSGETGLMTQISTKEAGGAPMTLAVDQQFSQYHSGTGSNAYQFSPNRTRFPFGEHLHGTPALCTIDAGFVHRAVQTYPKPSIVRETISVYDGITAGASAGVETKTEFRMHAKDRELVVRYRTSVNNTVLGHPSDSPAGVTAPLPVMETDSNGYLMMRRVTNKTGWGRDEEYFRVSMAVAGNYYPLSGSPGVARISDQGGSSGAFALLADTAHGAASLGQGWLEVMLGRRCDEQDQISVNDIDNVTAVNWLLVAPSRSAVALAQRFLARELSTPMVPVVVPKNSLAAQPSVGAPLPDQTVPSTIHLLSLDRLGVDTTPAADARKSILRLQHIMQADEVAGVAGAGPAAVLLRGVLAPAGVRITGAVEVLLNGLGQPTEVDLDTPLILQPLQIRTFVVSLTAIRGNL